ncbi:MAG TPA: SPASM domain-containing protein, partial [Fimbriimonas sp.]
GQPTFDQVIRGYNTLQRHRVDTNVLTVVNRLNGSQPIRTYRFLRDQLGAQFVQFIPVVERTSVDGLLSLAGPPKPRVVEPSGHVTEWSVLPDQYGQFLVEVYDEWVRRDVGRVFVQLFDVCLNVWSGRPSTLCWFGKTCGTALAIEHNGDVYACDHFVYPEFKLGNLLERPLEKMARSREQNAFGQAKAASLPQYCQKCEVRFMCNGECPKRRFLLTPDGEPGLNYLCEAYKRFFRHVDPSMRKMAELVRNRRPAADIMNDALLKPTNP